MRNYRHLSTVTLALLFLSGAFNPFNFFTVEVIAACTLENEVENDVGNDTENEPVANANVPDNNDEVTCNDEDTAGINAPDATNVTVTVSSPDGNISVTDTPGILLGDDATVTVVGPGGAVTVEGNSVPGIQVGNMTDVTDRANITISGTVATTGDLSSAIVTGDNATIRIDGGEGRQEIVDGETDEAESEVITVPDRGLVSTAGQQSVAVSVGANSMVRAVGLSQISTTGADADAVVLNGDDSQFLVGENATVATEGNRSNAVQMAGESNRLTVEGTVRSEAQNTTTVMSTGDNAVIEVRSGGVVTALASGANAIETTGTDARITIREGSDVTVAADDSAAIVTGSSSSARVTLQGTVSAAGDRSQGIVLGDDASLTVDPTGRLETFAATARAVVIDEMANSAEVNVARGEVDGVVSDGIIDAGSGQAIVDVGSTNTSVTIDGRVIGGDSAPVLALGGGNDDVTVNGSVSSTGRATVIDLGSGDDTLNDNSSQTISGSGVLASGGDGTDTLNLSNGKINDSADYRQFEVTNVGTNTNADDPLNGMGSTLNVTDNQSGNQINVASGSMLNVRSGGTVDLRADGTDNPSGGSGNAIAFDSGSTANVQVENVTGTQPVQNFTNTTFASGTAVNTSSGFIRGVASNDDSTGIGQVELSSDFTNSAQTANGMSVGRALNELADSETLSTEQQAALNALVAEASDTATGGAVLSQISGEVNAQAAASGVNAAMQFNNAILPSGNRVDSRGATIATDPNRAGRVFEQPAVGNGVWVSGLGSLLNVDRNDDSTTFDASTYGVAVGYDRAAELGTFGTAVFGVGAGYSSTEVDGVSDEATVNAFSLGTYLEGVKGPLSGHVAASYSSQDISSDRSSGGSGNLVVLSSEAFYNLQPGAGLAVGPIGRLGAAFGSYEGFSTENDTFGIDYGSADVSQVTGAVGVRIGGQNPVNVGFMALNLDLLYESSLGDNTIQFDGTMGESTVRLAAPTMNSSGFYIGAEAALAISDNSSAGFRYQGNLGSDIQSHTGEFKFSVLF